jgi:hypothetical protein
VTRTGLTFPEKMIHLYYDYSFKLISFLS